MNNYTVDVGPGILGKIGSMIGILLTGRVIMMTCTIIAVAVLTFNILDIFMKKSLFLFNTKKLDEDTGKSFRIALMVVIFTIIPLVAAIFQFVSRNGTILSTLIWIGISIALCWIFSLIMKRNMEDPPKKQLLLFEAIESVATTASSNIATWLAKFIIGVVNLIIKVIHIPFVMNYYIIAVIINLILSLILIKIVGISKEMGSANIIGSLVGGVVHAIKRKSEIKKIQKEYTEIHNEK